MDSWPDDFSIWISAFSAFIATVALVRPELSGVLRRWVNQLDFFPRGRLQVGFGTWGPTICMVGSIRSLGNEQFVREMIVRLTRVRDHKQHVFVWTVFRNQKVTLGQGMHGESAEATIATAFSLQKGESRTIDIQFCDFDTRDRYADDLARVKEEWNRSKINDQDIMAFLSKGNLGNAVEKFGNKYGRMIHELNKSAEREFYWEPGRCDIELIVLTSRPEKEFSFYGAFMLSDKEVETLRNNVGKMAIEVCDVNNMPYDFAWPKVNWAHMGLDAAR